MKKITSIIMLAAAAAAALVSCAKVEELASNEVNDKVEGKGIHITLVGSLAQTKTELGEDGLTPYWSAHDDITVAERNADVLNKLVSDDLASDKSLEASFHGYVDNLGTHFAVFSTNNAFHWEGGDDIILGIPAKQTIPATGTFDPESDILISQQFEVMDNGDVLSPSFKRITAFIKVTPRGTLGYTIDKVTISASQPLAGNLAVGVEDYMVRFDANESNSVEVTDGTYTLTTDGSKSTYVGIAPVTLAAGETLSFTIEAQGHIWTATKTLESDLTIDSGHILPINLSLTSENEATLKIGYVMSKKSTGSTAWNEYYGGTPGTDRNIAMDDNYVYVAENAGTAKLWAISLADPNSVKAVNVTGVSGGTHPLACPRILKNTNPSINGGEDILICSSLTRGGEDPKLYLWSEGIDNPPAVMNLTTWATGAWYGDVFTIWGSLQDGVLLFDKIGGDANGVVTFNLSGNIGSAAYLRSRIKFNDAIGSHSGACAFYPFPEDLTRGIYSPGRGVETRGRSAVVSGDYKTGEGGFDVTLTNLDYADGRNGFVLGYNYVEWKGKRYVIYGKQESSVAGHTYILEGSSSTDWLTIANTAGVKFRRDMTREDGCTLSSGNSGMDITARVINGDLYIAVQKQNIGCEVYRLYYE